MPKRTLALITGLILLTIILLFAATRTSQPPLQKTPTPSAPPLTLTPTPPAYTTLELSPNPVNLSKNAKGTIQVLINTDQNVATGVQMELSYDPSALTNIQVTPGTFFQNALIVPQWNKIDTINGRISHTQVLTPAQSGVKGKGIIATITFTKLPGTTLTQTSMQFLPKTEVTQSGITPSVLKASTGTTIYLSTPPVRQITQPNQTTNQ